MPDSRLQANVFFHNFEIKGGADRLLLYLTLYTSQCIGRMTRCKHCQAGTILWSLMFCLDSAMALSA